MESISTLQTTIVNLTDAELNISCIGKGIKLAANGEEGDTATVDGSITEAVGRGKSSVSAHQRAMKALEYMLEEGYIDIVSGPAPVLYDADDDLTKRLKMKNGKLYAVTPSWADPKFSSSL